MHLPAQRVEGYLGCPIGVHSDRMSESVSIGLQGFAEAELVRAFGGGGVAEHLLANLG
jgi:hypothetical protein